MKKIKFIILLLLIFILCGCSEGVQSGEAVSSKTDFSNKSGTVVCSREGNIDENSTTSLRYELDYKNGYVTILHSREEITSDNSDLLDTYEEAYKNVFERYKDLEYYDNTISRFSNAVLSDTVIQYNKIDIDALEKLENSNQSLYKDGKLSLNDWLTFAEKFGTKCTEK